MAPKRKRGAGNDNGESSSKGGRKAAKKGAFFADRPDDGIERLPGNGTGKSKSRFCIKRLIRYTDKTGVLLDQDAECPIDMDANYFRVQYGDFLLELGETREVEEVHVMNYYGQERFVPRRMLQEIYLPWGISRIQEDEDGVGLPLARMLQQIEDEDDNTKNAFDDEEVVLLLDEDGTDPMDVIDFERHIGSVPFVLAAQEDGTEAEEQGWELICEFPYDIHVDKDWLENQIAETVGKYGENGGNGKGTGKKNGKKNGKGGGGRKGQEEPEEEESEEDSEVEVNSGEEGPSDKRSKKDNYNNKGKKAASKAPVKEKTAKTPAKKATRKRGPSDAQTATAGQEVEGQRYACGFLTAKGTPCAKTYVYTNARDQGQNQCYMHQGK